MGTTRLGLAIDRQYHTDAQGTVGAITSGSNSDAGIVTNTFDAWGVALSQSGAGDGGSGGGVAPIAIPVVNAGFETPDPGTPPYNYAYDPTGAGVGWSFSGYADISGNGSGFTIYNPDAPEGVQVGVVQMTGSLSQPITLATGGLLEVSFQAARRLATGN